MEEEERKTVLENFFEDQEIRIMKEGNNKHWICLLDLCEIIKLDRSSKLVQQIIKKYMPRQKFLSHTDALNREEKYIYVCKRAAYEILFRTNKPQAEKFRDFIFELLDDLEENYIHLIEDAIKKHKERDVERLSVAFLKKNEQPHICLCKSKPVENKKQYYSVTARQEKSISMVKADHEVLLNYKLGNGIAQKNKFKELLKENNIKIKGSTIQTENIDEELLRNIFIKCYEERLL